VAGCGKVSREKDPVITQHFTDVLPGFSERRKSPVTVDDMLARVIGCQRKREVSAKSIQQLSEVFRSSADVVFRIVQISHIHSGGGLRHQLHETDCPCP